MVILCFKADEKLESLKSVNGNRVKYSIFRTTKIKKCIYIYIKKELNASFSSAEIPQYRLPFDVVSFELDLVRDLGVKVSKENLSFWKSSFTF